LTDKVQDVKIDVSAYMKAQWQDRLNQLQQVSETMSNLFDIARELTRSLDISGAKSWISFNFPIHLRGLFWE
jgi:hypothetical protein